MNYKTYEISIATANGLKFVEVVACDLHSAQADVVETYGADVEIVSSRVL